MSSKPTLAYWRIRGLAQPIRFLLAYLGVDYEDKIYDEGEQWMAEKQNLNLDFPNLPYLLDGSARVTETRAIMKYLCRTRKAEMLGKTVKEQTDIDTVDNLIYDIFYVGIVPVIYQYTEEKEKQFKEMAAAKLGYLNNFMKGKQYVAGTDITYVDFFTYEVLRDLRVFDGKILDNFPNLQTYVSKVENLPAIQEYMKSPSFIEKPIFGPSSIIKI